MSQLCYTGPSLSEGFLKKIPVGERMDIGRDLRKLDDALFEWQIMHELRVEKGILKLFEQAEEKCIKELRSRLGKERSKKIRNVLSQWTWEERTISTEVDAGWATYVFYEDRLPVGLLKQLDPLDVGIITAINADPFHNLLDRSFYESYFTGGQKAFAEFGIAASFQLRDPLIEEFAKNYNKQLSSRVTQQISTKVRKEIFEGIRAGMGSDELVKQVQKVFAEGITVKVKPLLDERGNIVRRGYTYNMSNKFWATTVARSEVIRASAEGRLEGYAQMGLEKVAWQATGDHRTCPDCAAMQGQVFTIEESHGMIPLHCLGRCTFIPILPKKYRQASKNAKQNIQSLYSAPSPSAITNPFNYTTNPSRARIFDYLTPEPGAWVNRSDAMSFVQKTFNIGQSAAEQRVYEVLRMSKMEHGFTVATRRKPELGWQIAGKGKEITPPPIGKGTLEKLWGGTPKQRRTWQEYIAEEKYVKSEADELLRTTNKLFKGKDVSPDDILRGFSIEGDEILSARYGVRNHTIRVQKELGPTPEGIRVGGEFYVKKTGEALGRFEQQILHATDDWMELVGAARTDILVSNEFIEITRSGEGIGRAFMRSNADLYDHMKIHTIYLDADRTGQYVWAKYGFKAWDDEFPAIRKAFLNHLENGGLKLSQAEANGIKGMHDIANFQVPAGKTFGGGVTTPGKEFLLGGDPVFGTMHPSWSGYIKWAEKDGIGRRLFIEVGRPVRAPTPSLPPAAVTKPVKPKKAPEPKKAVTIEKAEVDLKKAQDAFAKSFDDAVKELKKYAGYTEEQVLENIFNIGMLYKESLRVPLSEWLNFNRLGNLKLKKGFGKLGSEDGRKLLRGIFDKLAQSREGIYSAKLEVLRAGGVAAEKLKEETIKRMLGEGLYGPPKANVVKNHTAALRVFSDEHILRMADNGFRIHYVSSTAPEMQGAFGVYQTEYGRVLMGSGVKDKYQFFATIRHEFMHGLDDLFTNNGFLKHFVGPRPMGATHFPGYRESGILRGASGKNAPRWKSTGGWERGAKKRIDSHYANHFVKQTEAGNFEALTDGKLLGQGKFWKTGGRESSAYNFDVVLGNFPDPYMARIYRGGKTGYGMGQEYWTRMGEYLFNATENYVFTTLREGAKVSIEGFWKAIESATTRMKPAFGRSGFTEWSAGLDKWSFMRLWDPNAAKYFESFFEDTVKNIIRYAGEAG